MATATTSALVQTAELAERLGITRQTLAIWRALGEVGPQPVTKRGHPRWNRAEVEAWLAATDGKGGLHTAATWPTAWNAMRKKRPA